MSDNLQEQYLLFKAEKGLKKRELWNEKYRERLTYELSVINQMGFPGYFLVVADFCEFAREAGYGIGPGRGSASGSLVAYAVRITDVDPIKWDLAFERFLNPFRVSMPDIDTDLSQRHRNKIIQYVIEKYGQEKVCQIGTIGTMKAKLAIKDVGRTLGLDPATLNRYSSLVPDEARGGQGSHAVTLKLCVKPTLQFLKEHEHGLTDFRNAYEFDENFHRIIDIALDLEGVPKSFGVHPAGVIICDEDLSKCVPLRGKDGIPISQWTDKQVESMAFVKFDFLGLRTLDVINDACKSIERRSGVEIDWDVVPEDDEATFDMLSSGDCFGVFQLSEGGIQGYTKSFKPRSIDEIASVSSLWRPGPMDYGSPKAALRVRSGEEEPNYPVSELESILKPTDGILVYQEQVLAIAVAIAGYSLGEADLLRRAIGKKLPVEMAKQEERFITGGKDKGFDKTLVRDLWNMINGCADYLFNRAHAISYSILSYRTAYLKCHYPSDFYAAEFSSYEGEVADIMKCMGDARLHHVQLLPPDINLSDREFTATGDLEVRLGLEAIKGLGSAALQNLFEAREIAKFVSVEDLIERTNSMSIKSNNLQALAYSGALSNIHEDMNRLEIARYAIDYAAAYRKALTKIQKVSDDQLDMFTKLEIPKIEASALKPKISVRPFEELELEKESLGLYVSASPLDQYDLIKQKTHIDDIASIELDDLWVSILARISSVQIRRGKGGNYAFLELEDNSGIMRAKVWSNKMPNCSHNLIEGALVVARGKTSSYRGIELSVDSIVLAEDELTRILGRVVLKRLDFKILNYIMRLSPGKVPIDYEIPNCFRQRLGLFDLGSDELRELNDLD